MLNQKLITELKAIIKEEYGMELRSQAVAEVADTLTSYFGLLTKINHQERSKQKKSHGKNPQP